MRNSLCLLLVSILSLPALGGPYAPAAGQPGSTAVLKTDSRIAAWASRVASYQVGTDCLPQWQDTSKALGPATTDPTHITCLGSGGTITLAFPGFITNGAGPDFAVFENAFGDTFLECAFVEVSRDGINFTRFPNHSLTPASVGAFGTLDPTNIQGLGCKYRQPYGEPYDLADVGMDEVAFVRLVDVVGDGSAHDSDGNIIYDSYPAVQSAGFDLDAIAVLHLQIWQSQTVAQLNGSTYASATFDHLPDGRFLLGVQGTLSLQTAWGQSGKTAIGNGGVEFEPSFISVRNATSALLGQGGGFGEGTGLHGFNPATPATAVQASPLATMQNFAAVYWHSPTTSREGWIVGGTNGAAGKHDLSFVSLDGSKVGKLTQELCTYSSGLATDGSGNVFAALYELAGSPNAADAEKVLRFSSASVESAVVAILNGSPSALPKSAGSPVFTFDSASSLAIDALGRIWASGFKFAHIQIYDPSTGAMRRMVPDHPAIPNVSEVLYQVKTFSRDGQNYAAFLAQDLFGTENTSIVHGITPLSSISVVDTLASWQAFQFGAANLTPVNEATLWGPAADPDHDGLSNLVEYGLHTLPLSFNASPVTASTSASRLNFTFPRDPLHTDLQYVVEAANDLPSAVWTPIASSSAGEATAAVSPAAPLISEATSGALQIVSVRDTITQSSQARRFLRLRISTNQ